MPSYVDTELQIDFDEILKNCQEIIRKCESYQNANETNLYGNDSEKQPRQQNDSKRLLQQIHNRFTANKRLINGQIDSSRPNTYYICTFSFADDQYIDITSTSLFTIHEEPEPPEPVKLFKPIISTVQQQNTRCDRAVQKPLCDTKTPTKNASINEQSEELPIDNCDKRLLSYASTSGWLFYRCILKPTTRFNINQSQQLPRNGNFFFQMENAIEEDALNTFYCTWMARNWKKRRKKTIEQHLQLSNFIDERTTQNISRTSQFNFRIIFSSLSI